MTEKEITELVDKVSAANEELEKRSAELAQKEADFQKREAALSNNNPANVRSNNMDNTEAKQMFLRDLEQAMIEKRNVTLNGTGATAYMTELFKAAMQKSKLAGRVRTKFSPSSSYMIPVLAPRPATPSAQAEGATGVAADSTAALAPKTIAPAAYFSEINISYEALKMGAANLEAELPGIFRDAFVSALDDGIVTGAQSGAVKGIWTAVPTANKIACAAAGLPTLADMVALAEKLNDYDIADPVIVMSPTVHAALLAENSSVYDFVKEELARNKSILGCEVIVTGKAPSTVTAGSVIATGLSLSNYMVGIAAELEMRTVYTAGQTGPTFQAIMCMGGTPIVDSAIYALKTV